MKCGFWNDETELKIWIHKISYNDKKIIITNVPIEYWNCCTEEYYSAGTVENLEKILEIVKSYKVKDNKIVVDYEEIIKPFYSLSSAYKKWTGILEKKLRFLIIFLN